MCLFERIQKFPFVLFTFICSFIRFQNDPSLNSMNDWSINEAKSVNISITQLDALFFFIAAGWNEFKLIWIGAIFLSQMEILATAWWFDVLMIAVIRKERICAIGVHQMKKCIWFRLHFSGTQRPIAVDCKELWFSSTVVGFQIHDFIMRVEGFDGVRRT